MYYVVIFNSRADFALFYEFMKTRVWEQYKERVLYHKRKTRAITKVPYHFIKLTEWNGRRFWKFKNLKWAQHLSNYGLTVRQWNPDWGDENNELKRYVFDGEGFKRVK